MVRDLQGAEVQAGRHIAEALNEVFGVRVALWEFNTDRMRWLLILAVSNLAKLGPRRVYEQVLNELPSDGITLDDVRVVDVSDAVAVGAQLIRPWLETGEYPEIENVIAGDHFFDKAVFIWTSRPLTEGQKKERDRQARLRKRGY